MTIGRISGGMLLPNLERDGVDLSIDNNLLYFDSTNRRVGIRTFLPPIFFNAIITGNILTVTVPPIGEGVSIGMVIGATDGDEDTSNITGARIIAKSGSSWVLNKTFADSVQGRFSGQIAPKADVVISGTVRVNDQTNSLSCDTGALVVDGGVGIGKDLNVCGDIFMKGSKLISELDFYATRKTYSFEVPTLATGQVFYYTAEIGYTNIIYSLSIIAPVKVEVFGTKAGQLSMNPPNPYDQNPYTFIATSRRVYDDGTIYFSDGTSMQTRQYSIFANLEEPVNKNIYFKITGVNDIHGGWAASDLAFAASFTGSILGTNLTVTGTVVGRPLAVGMTITGLSGILPDTKIVSGSGFVWVVSQSHASTVAGNMTGTILKNILTLYYVDSAGDGGATDISTVAVLPVGYDGQMVYLTTTSTMYVFFNKVWRAI
jgi:hypothetical protein